MFTILIVDDEPRQVKALVSVVQQLKPTYTVLEAFDGDEALVIIQNNPVHILISDINMPHLSGMDLIKSISTGSSSPKIVMLTGYDEFEFAVQALRYQVFDYLLKPIGKSELIVLLDRLESLLLEEQTNNQLVLTDQQQLAVSVPVYEHYLMNQWIQSKATRSELSEISKRFPTTTPSGTIIHLKLHTRMGCSDAEMTLIVSSLQQSLQRQFSRYDNFFVFRSEADHPTLIFPYFCESSDDIHTILLPALERLTHEYGPESGLSLMIAVGTVVEDLIENAAESFRKGQLAMRGGFYGGSGPVILATDRTPGYNSRFPFKEEFSLFMSALNETDDYFIQKCIGEHLDKLTLHNCDPELVKDEWYSFMLQLVKGVRSQLQDEEYKKLLTETKQKLYDCWECYGLRSVLLSFLLRVKALVHNHSNTQQQVIISQCIRFLTHNYQKDISLEEISQKYHFHPSYFSTLFKSIAGIGFSEYLSKIRIDEAKHLILNTDKKMNEIAHCVGFRDAAYFNKSFKKEAGISPNKYKRSQKLE